MTPRTTLATLVLALATSTALASTPTTTNTLPSLPDRGHQTLALIEQRLRATDHDRPYLQELRPADPNFHPHPAFNWPLGIQLSALNAAAKLDPQRYNPAVADCIKLLDAYWTDANGIAGYAASYHPRHPDRYYDDNAWIVLGLLEAHDQTHDPTYLDRAKRAAAFVFSGEDPQLGGGLFWRESEKKSKHTCSNAPATVAALRLFQITHDPQYRQTADRLYAWTTRTLQDPADGLFFDHINLDATLDRTKWTYNAALMIRANGLFFDVTKEARYLAESQRIATAAVSRWFKPDGRVTDNSYFAHLLCEALLELAQRDGDPRWGASVARTADFVWTRNRDADGVHPERWDTMPDKPLARVELMPQASAARLFFRLEAYQRGRR